MSAHQVAQQFHGSFRRVEPRLRWHTRRGRYYIVWSDGRSQVLRSTGTADLAEAEVSLRLFKEAPASFLTARERSPWGRPMLPVKPRCGVVYFIGCEGSTAIKIGVSESADVRMKDLQCGSPVRLVLLATVLGGLKEERAYHARFASSRLHGEWFERTPELLAEIDRLQTMMSK
jgi:hypothetical protein